MKDSNIAVLDKPSAIKARGRVSNSTPSTTKLPIQINADSEQNTHIITSTMDNTVNLDSPAVSILKTALAKVEEVSSNADKTIQMLQQNLQQVSSQRIGLQHQQNMLIELIEKIGNAEKQTK